MWAVYNLVNTKTIVKLGFDVSSQGFNSKYIKPRLIVFGVIACIATIAASAFIRKELRNVDIDSAEWTYGSGAFVATSILSLLYVWNWGVIMARPEMYAGLYTFVRVPLKYTGLMWYLLLIPILGALYFTFTLPLVICLIISASVSPPLLHYIFPRASWSLAAIEFGTIVVLLLLLYFSYSSEETKEYLRRNQGPQGLGYIFYLFAKHYVSQVDEQLAANEVAISIGN